MPDSRPKWAKSIPFFRLKSHKTIPFGAAHIFMAYVRKYLIQGRHCINITGQLKLLPLATPQLRH